MDWSVHYPAFVDPASESSTTQDGGTAHITSRKRMMRQVEVADIGCGFGGLLFALAPKMPDTLIMGMPLPSKSASQKLGLTYTS